MHLHWSLLILILSITILIIPSMILFLIHSFVHVRLLFIRLIFLIITMSILFPSINKIFTSSRILVQKCCYSFVGESLRKDVFIDLIADMWNLMLMNSSCWNVGLYYSLSYAFAPLKHNPWSLDCPDCCLWNLRAYKLIEDQLFHIADLMSSIHFAADCMIVKCFLYYCYDYLHVRSDCSYCNHAIHRSCLLSYPFYSVLFLHIHSTSHYSVRRHNVIVHIYCNCHRIGLAAHMMVDRSFLFVFIVP